MDKSKLIENIKSQLKSLMSSEVKFAEVKAGDLMITSPDEELVVGSEVFKTDESGNNVPLTDGEYTLDSGEKIAVVGGKIEGIVASEAEGKEIEIEVKSEVEVDEEVSEEEVPAEDVEVDETDEEMGSKKMKELEERMVKCEKMLEEMSKANNQMKQELASVSSEPSKASISVEPTEFKSVEEKKNGTGSIDIMAIRERARASRK
jgi:hypothetical protein